MEECLIYHDNACYVAMCADKNATIDNSNSAYTQHTISFYTSRRSERHPSYPCLPPDLAL